MNGQETVLIRGCGGPFGQARAVAGAARDVAYQSCKSPKLRALAHALDDFETRMWNRGDDTGRFVALAVTLVAALLLDSPRLTHDQISAAPERIMKALDAAAMDYAGYRRDHEHDLLSAYRALYSDVYAHCRDAKACAAAQAVIRAGMAGSRARNYEEALRADIDAIKQAIALVQPGSKLA
ncbi:conserved hypothetical protein [Burkholderia cepacia]|nr:conserved hypothetical protein [Burkholderia cepacia]